MICLIWIAATLVAQRVVAISEQEFVDSTTPSKYCGIYCVYAALNANGVQREFHDFLSPKYLTGEHGSSVSDLTALLKDLGLEGSPRSGLSIDDLRMATCPWILHVRSPSGISYSHWVLFLGIDSMGRVKVYDPPTGVGAVSLAELQVYWDGVGISVAKTQDRWIEALPISVSYLILIFLFCIVQRLLSQKTRGLKYLLLFMAIICFSIHCLLPTGFAYNHGALGSAAGAHFQQQFHEIEKEELQTRSDSCVLIDARSEETYKEWHIPGSINVPIGSGIVAMNNRIASIDKSKDLVVYCQSSRCRWADSIANQIAFRTGKRVEIYRGGVEEWKNNHDAK